jgi:hypothetical protein
MVAQYAKTVGLMMKKRIIIRCRNEMW